MCRVRAATQLLLEKPRKNGLIPKYQEELRAKFGFEALASLKAHQAPPQKILSALEQALEATLNWINPYDDAVKLVEFGFSANVFVDAAQFLELFDPKRFEGKLPAAMQKVMARFVREFRSLRPTTDQWSVFEKRIGPMCFQNAISEDGA